MLEENEKICCREMRKGENMLESVNLGSCRGSGDRFQSSHDRLEDTIAHQGVADDIGKQFKERGIKYCPWDRTHMLILYPEGVFRTIPH